jgi:hypothetical protein
MPMKFRGRASRALDDWYSTGDVTNNLTEARRLLQSGRSFTQIINDLRVRRHTRPEFVYPAGLAVLRRPEFEPAARDSYLDAIKLALDHSPAVPIRTTWETGAGNTEFEFALTDGGDHIEVTVRLPQGDIDPAGEEQLGLTDVQRH